MGWDNLADQVEKMCEKMVKDVKTEASQIMLRSISEHAPVKTGNLLGNTIVSSNPDHSTNSIEDPTRTKVYSDGMNKVNLSSPYEKIYIQNNTEYNLQAEYLGWARTPAYGYFGISVENVNRMIERRK